MLKPRARLHMLGDRLVHRNLLELGRYDPVERMVELVGCVVRWREESHVVGQVLVKGIR